MANAKSNIYPIQLQGAELNLNKLDAEIKQYSGFNKNNSPFVGGCLANVFTKETQIEDANDDNTIITENGDVYKAEGNTLYKNDEVLHVFQSGDLLNPSQFNGFWNIRKLNNNVVRYFNDDIYVLKSFVSSGIEYKLHINGVEQDTVLATLGISNLLDVDNYEQKAFNAVFIKSPNSDYKYFCVVTTYLIPSTSFQFSAFRVSIITCDLQNNFSLSSSDAQTFTQNRNREVFSVIPCYNGQHLFIISNSKAFCYQLSSEGLLTFVLSTSSVMSQDDNLYAYTNLSNYAVVEHPLNYMSLKRVDFVENVNKDLIISGDFSLNVEQQKLVLYNVQTLGTTLSSIGVSGQEYFDQTFFNRQGTRTPLLSCYDLQKECTYDNNLVSMGLHFSGKSIKQTGFSFYTPSEDEVKFNDYEYIRYSLGDYLPLSDLWFLFNNNFLSGVGGKNVLFEGWNDIDEWSLSYFPDESYIKLYYKKGKDWYVLEKTPNIKIKRIKNQIVVNADDYVNSYDLNLQKMLLFAPNWNNRLSVSYPIGEELSLPLGLYPLDTSGLFSIFVASAINEYKQEENSSIILNPVRISVMPDTSPLHQYKFEVTINMSSVNYYQGENLILYSKTSLGYGLYRINKDLYNLPFPSDTNGNVEYSPSLFVEVENYGNMTIMKNGDMAYPLVVGNNNETIMSFFLASGIENLEAVFIIQGQYFGVINSNIYSLQYANGVVQNVQFIVNAENLQFIGNTPYEALFFSKTNRCLYSFIGANILNQKQFVDKISEVRDYLYNSATQTVFLITDIGVIFYSAFGQFLLEYTDVTKIFIQQNGIILSFNNGNYRFIKYYLDEGDTDFEKQRIKLETCFYGMNNEVVTINDCLYVRLFSEEHEEGNLEISATTLSLSGRMTEKTTFNIKASDWDAITHTIYLRYQPKEQRGLGISFSIDSPFKIASLSVGSQADAVLVDKISKKAITAPSVTSNDDEW